MDGASSSANPHAYAASDMRGVACEACPASNRAAAAAAATGAATRCGRMDGPCHFSFLTRAPRRFGSSQRSRRAREPSASSVPDAGTSAVDDKSRDLRWHWGSRELSAAAPPGWESFRYLGPKREILRIPLPPPPAPLARQAVTGPCQSGGKCATIHFFWFEWNRTRGAAARLSSATRPMERWRSSHGGTRCLERNRYICGFWLLVPPGTEQWYAG